MNLCDIDDGHGNFWSRCKLGADCGLKVIEAGKARCWCQDQETSRVEVQAAREEIENLETRVDQLERENAALREALIKIRSMKPIHMNSDVYGKDYGLEPDDVFEICDAALTKKDAQP